LDRYGRATDPHRNGGVRCLREIDLWDAEERAVYGKGQYTWRLETGPAPKVSCCDRDAATAYLFHLEIAQDKGGWTTNEASGLRREIKKWRKRAKGLDPKYNLHGNRPGGYEDPRTAADIKDAKIVQSVLSALSGFRRRLGSGD
jgi:hypothetical protein